MNFWKAVSIILAVILIVFMFRDCKHKASLPIISRDTIMSIKYDTVLLKHTDTLRVYVPQIVKSVPPKKEEIIIPKDVDDLKDKYVMLANVFYTTNVYKDSLTLKDSTGNKIGIVNFTDSVKENVISSRSINYSIAIPVVNKTITTTITNTIKEKPKNKFYIGGGVVGNQYDYIKGAAGNIMWQNKKDGILQAGVIANRDGTVVYNLIKYWKIKL